MSESKPVTSWAGKTEDEIVERLALVLKMDKEAAREYMRRALADEGDDWKRRTAEEDLGPPE